MKRILILAVCSLALVARAELTKEHQAELRVLLDAVPKEVLSAGTPGIVAYLNRPVVIREAVTESVLRVVNVPIGTVTNNGSIVTLTAPRTNSAATRVVRPAETVQRCPFVVTGKDIEAIQRQ